MLPKHILIPTDFSEHSAAATAYGVELAKKLEAQVLLLSTYTVPAIGAPDLTGEWVLSLRDDLEREGQQAMLEVLQRHRASGVKLEGLVQQGDPRTAIVAAARDHSADLIVMGTHGRSGVSRLVLGSVAESVLRQAPCPVLTVRAKA